MTSALERPSSLGRVSVMLAVLSMVSFFNYLDRMSLAVLIEPIKRDLHLSDTQAGLITGLAFALFYAVLGVPIGRLADRANKGGLLAGCVALWSLMTSLSGLSTSFATLFIARIAVGVGESGCVPTSFALISERLAPHKRPLAISIFQASGLCGIALGMVTAGLAGQVLGWRHTLIAIGIAGLPVSVLVLLFIRPGATAPRASTVKPMWTEMRALLRNPGYTYVVMAISCAAFATYGIIQWLTAFLMRSFGASLATIGFYTGLTTGVGGILGTLMGGAIAGRLSRRRPEWDLWVPAVVYAASAPLFLATFLSPRLELALAFNFLATTVAAAGGGVALAALQRFTVPERRATANALMLMISALFGVGLGPVVVGLASDWLHPWQGQESLRWALASLTVVFLFGSLLFVRAARHEGMLDGTASSATPVTARVVP